jgi:hypothetical protein
LAAAPNWELLAFLPAAILGAVAQKYVELLRQKQAEPDKTQIVEDNPRTVENPSDGSCG